MKLSEIDVLGWFINKLTDWVEGRKEGSYKNSIEYLSSIASNIRGYCNIYGDYRTMEHIWVEEGSAYLEQIIGEAGRLIVVQSEKSGWFDLILIEKENKKRYTLISELSVNTVAAYLKNNPSKLERYWE